MTWGELLIWMDANPGLAAWVQATGSVVAILAAVAIASQQHRNDQRCKKEDAKQRSIAHAVRLYMIAKEFADVVDKVLDPIFQDGAVDADARVANSLERILLRLNSNFDDDFDTGRMVQIGVLRSSLVGVIFLLKTTEHLSQEEREDNVNIYKRLAPDILEHCSELIKKAKAV